MTQRYMTSDLGQAAYLIVRGHPLLGMGGVTGGKRVFCFPPDASSEAQSFYQRAMVPAREYFTAVRDLKALVLQP